VALVLLFLLSKPLFSNSAWSLTLKVRHLGCQEVKRLRLEGLLPSLVSWVEGFGIGRGCGGMRYSYARRLARQGRCRRGRTVPICWWLVMRVEICLGSGCLGLEMVVRRVCSWVKVTSTKSDCKKFGQNILPKYPLCFG